MTDLIERLHQLQPEQRAALARQLAAPGSGTAPGNTRLLAFVVPDGGSTLDPARLRASLAQRLPDYMLPHQIVPLTALPLMPNGKVDLKALTAMPTAVNEAATRFAEPGSETEQTLVQIWSEVLSLDMLGIHDNFFEIGGDSILSIQIVARARRAGLEFTPALLFKYPTIAELASIIATSQPQQAMSEQGLITGVVPLTPIQRWFFENNLQRPAQWNQGLLLRLKEPVSSSALREAVNALLHHHDALRTRFVQQNGQWMQEQLGMPAALPVEDADLRGKTPAEQAALVEEIATRQHRSLHLAQADLFRVVHIRYSDAEEGLLLILHHLVVDGISWRILLEDLHTALEQGRQGKPITLPPKTTSLQAWSQQLQHYGDLPQAAAALDYWLAAGYQAAQSLPRDHAADLNLNTVENGQVITERLDEAETRALLEDVPGVYHTQINDVLLTALAQTLTEWSGEPDVLLAMEGHGREALFDGVDLTRTVGWLTSVFPVRLQLPPVADPGESLLAIKEQLRAIPDNGISHGLLRHNGAHQAQFTGQPHPDVLFNYLGRNDTLLQGLHTFALESDSPGEPRHPADPRRYLIEINCLIRNGCFESRWSYSRHHYAAGTMERMATRFHQYLRDLIQYCLSPEAGGHSLSDFPLADLNAESFDQIASLLNQLDD